MIHVGPRSRYSNNSSRTLYFTWSRQKEKSQLGAQCGVFVSTGRLAKYLRRLIFLRNLVYIIFLDTTPLMFINGWRIEFD